MTTTAIAEQPTCGDCKFWVQVSHGNLQGACHEGPPMASNSWPYTSHTDWCGRWKRRTPPKAQAE